MISNIAPREVPASSARAADAEATGGRLYAALRPLIVPVCVIVGWSLASVLIGVSTLPSPVETASAFMEGVSDGWLPASLWTTFQVAAVSFLAAAVLGLAVGIALGMSRFWGDVLGPPLHWMFSLPKITVFPVFLLIFGLGFSSRTAFGAFHGFFPLAIIVFSGVNLVPEVYRRSARSLNLTRYQTIRHVIVPATLPSMISGMRFCFSMCFIGVVLAEMFGSSEGAGYELVHRIALHQLPEVFAIAFSLMGIALLINFGLMSIDVRRAVRYWSNVADRIHKR